MHIVILAPGKNDTLSIQHLHHHPANAQTPERSATRNVNLLILDARDMSNACLELAARKVVEIRTQNGLRHGVLLCDKPALPLLVASIRCGLRDVITQHIDAAHLRQILRSAEPGLTRSRYSDTIAFLRTLTAFSGNSGDATLLARRAQELGQLATSLTERENEIASEKDRLARLEKDIRERTRRLDRQIARLQNDSDVLPSSASPANSPEMGALAQRLEKRSAELDLREKLLNEMQTLLLSAPQAPVIRKHTSLANNPAGLIG